MKALLSFLALSLLLISPANANTKISELPAGSYALDKTHASLIWKVSHLGLSNYTARFTDFDAELTLDPEDVTQSSLIVTIDPTSLETDYPNPEEKDFDKKLIESEQWFNAGKFPEIKFASKRIEVTGTNTGKVYGTLDFLGVQEPLVMDVTFNGSMLEHPYAKKAALGFSAKTVLQRSQWGFDTYLPNIGDNVEVLVEVEFIKADDVPETTEENIDSKETE